MGEFFHNWRRKMGVVTLLMACLVTTAWGRSRIANSRVSWPIGQNIDYANVLNRDGIWLGKYQRFGIDLGNLLYVIDYEPESILVPYWSIGIPLTVISVWLLLSKPGKSTQKKTAELTPV